MKQMLVIVTALAACSGRTSQNHPREDKAPDASSSGVVAIPTPSSSRPGATQPTYAELEASRRAHVEHLANVDFSTDASFDQTTVPLGLSIAELKKRSKRCKIVKEGFPEAINGLSDLDPPDPALFPLANDVYPGLVVTHKGTTLRRKNITVYFRKCPNGSPLGDNIGVLNTTGQIYFVNKLLIAGDGGRRTRFEEAREALGAKCGSRPSPIHEGTFENLAHERRQGWSSYCDQGFLRTVVASSTLLDSIIIGNVALGVTYIDMLAWRQFIDQERARVEPSAKGVEALKAQF